METYSILVGKLYRMPDNELREVHAMEKGVVVYLAATPNAAPRRLSLVQFAAEVESQVVPPPQACWRNLRPPMLLTGHGGARVQPR
jgi:hypothetical protein